MSNLMVSVSGVRGIVGDEFNPLVVGRWTAALSRLLGPGPVVLGRDSRTTGPPLAGAACSILQAMGREVFDLGVVPTPTVQIAVEEWHAAGGIILSASHNPAQWNALKFVDAGGSFLSPERFGLLRSLAEMEPAGFVRADDFGALRGRRDEALRLHREAILKAVDKDAIRAAGMRVALDTGHGAGGVLLEDLALDLGVGLDGHRLEPSGLFADNPEPTTAALKLFLNSLDRPAAFAAMVDPDADRLAVALPGTEVVGEEWTLPLVAASVLAVRSGAVVTNLSTSTRLESVAAGHGSRVYRSPVGEANVVAEMKLRNAVLGGEGNGGVIDPAVHLGRDAAVAFARLCEAEALNPGGLRALAGAIPSRYLAKLKLPIGKEALFRGGERLASLLGDDPDRRDGLRWSTEDGFVHVRPSGTEPVVRVIVEAADRGAAEGLLTKVRDILSTE